MRLPLAEGSYQTRTLAASAQRCLNWYQESIETASGSGKATRILRQTPGLHLFADLAALSGHAGIKIRGMWSGGGRLFVVASRYVFEVKSDGTLISTQDLVSNDALPVYMAGNGNQLGMVYTLATIPQTGLFLINNGAGFVQAHYQISGTVTSDGANPSTLTWVSGEQFPATMVAGFSFYLDGIVVTVGVYTGATSITLTTQFTGGGAGTVSTYFNSVFWQTGTVFNQSMVGRPITIGTAVYTVKDVVGSYTLHLADGQDAGIQSGVAYNAAQPNLPYSAAAGAAVAALTLAYLDGQFYVQQPSGGTPDLGRNVNFSAVNDGTVWNGLDFFVKEGSPDYIQSIFADREQLYVFGTESSEVYQNDPNTGRPVRIQGAVIKEGSAARYCVVSIQEHIYYIGGSPVGSPVAYRLDGFTPTRISTHAVEQAWATNSLFISAAISWSYLEDGHYFWVICFGNGSSWAYDATEKVWHERQSWSTASGGFFLPYRPWFHTFIPEWSAVDGGLNGLHIVGDYNSGKLFIMSSAYFDEESIDVRRIRDLPYLYGGQGKRVYVGRVDLDMATGLIPSGTEPTVELSWSDDNGASYSTPESSGFGLAGQTNKRAFWIAQGSAEVSRIPRITITGQAQTSLVDMEAEVEIGDS